MKIAMRWTSVDSGASEALRAPSPFSEVEFRRDPSVWSKLECKVCVRALGVLGMQRAAA